MKVSGVCGAANLYRQSAMSFNLYFQALLSAVLSQTDGMTAQQVQPARRRRRRFLRHIVLTATSAFVFR